MTVDQQLRQGLLERIEHLHQLVDVSAGDALLTWLVEGRGGRGRFGIVPEVPHEDAPEGIASSDEVLAVAAQGHARDLIAVPLEGLEFFATGRPHRHAVLSKDPVTRCLPSPLRATLTTKWVCPLKLWRAVATIHQNRTGTSKRLAS
jgi:hypothetical protein